MRTSEITSEQFKRTDHYVVTVALANSEPLPIDDQSWRTFRYSNPDDALRGLRELTRDYPLCVVSMRIDSI